MFNRIKCAWAVLRGKIVTPEKIYVYPAEHNPNKFVQLIAYRDGLLALDAEGRVWAIKDGGTGYFYYQQVLESPRRSY